MDDQLGRMPAEEHRMPGSSTTSWDTAMVPIRPGHLFGWNGETPRNDM
jgi:hypothetical protein